MFIWISLAWWIVTHDHCCKWQKMSQMSQVAGLFVVITGCWVMVIAGVRWEVSSVLLHHQSSAKCHVWGHNQIDCGQQLQLSTMSNAYATLKHQTNKITTRKSMIIIQIRQNNPSRYPLMRQYYKLNCIFWLIWNFYSQAVKPWTIFVNSRQVRRESFKWL